MMCDALDWGWGSFLSFVDSWRVEVKALVKDKSVVVCKMMDLPCLETFFLLLLLCALKWYCFLVEDHLRVNTCAYEHLV